MKLALFLLAAIGVMAIIIWPRVGTLFDESKQLAELVDNVRRMHLPVEQKQSFLEREGQLLLDEHGTITAFKFIDDKLAVVIDRGGGHRGARGFVYSEPGVIPDQRFKELLGLNVDLQLSPMTEKLWWSYRSLEE